MCWESIDNKSFYKHFRYISKKEKRHWNQYVLNLSHFAINQNLVLHVFFYFFTVWVFSLLRKNFEMNKLWDKSSMLIPNIKCHNKPLFLPKVNRTKISTKKMYFPFIFFVRCVLYACNHIHSLWSVAFTQLNNYRKNKQCSFYTVFSVTQRKLQFRSILIYSVICNMRGLLWFLLLISMNAKPENSWRANLNIGLKHTFLPSLKRGKYLKETLKSAFHAHILSNFISSLQ